MIYLFSVLYVVTAGIASCCVIVRLKCALPVWRSLAINAAVISMLLTGILLANGQPGLALMVLGIGYMVTAYGALYWFVMDSFVDVPLVWPWSRTNKPLEVPAMQSRTRPTMYQRVRLVSPQTLHRALRIVKDPKLRIQIDALLQVYKRRKQIRRVA